MLIKKSNNINPKINTSKNPKTNIFYGNGVSKFLFQLDLDDLKHKLEKGEFTLTTNTKHYLHLTNTVFNRDYERAINFELVLFIINESWDEGVGYEYVDGDETPSNWLYKNSLSEWSENQLIHTTNYKKIFFEKGDEDVHVDITDYVNEILTDERENYGLGISFPEDYFLENKEIAQSVSFFTKYHNGFYKPYLETVFDDVIQDDRDNFIGEQLNNLYLYCTKYGEYVDLDENPIVDILNSNKTPIQGLTNMEASKVRKGIYKISFGISGELCDGKRFFYDIWKNVKINGFETSTIKQKFIPKSFLDDFDFNMRNDDTYAIQVNGIKVNERIKNGERRKIGLSLKSINTRKSIVLNDVYYRLYVKEGTTNVIVHDWTKMDKTKENSFILDTTYLLPCEYFMEFKTIVNGTEYFFPNEIKFEIINRINTSNIANEKYELESFTFDYTFDIILE